VRADGWCEERKCFEDGKGRRAVIDGSLPDVEQTQPDVTDWPRDDTAEPADPPPPPPHQATSPVRKQRRNRGSVLKSLGRLWIPFVVIAVLAGGGLTVYRLHGIFGSEKSLSYGDTKNDKGKTYNPKKMKYEIFGPPGTSAQISYFDEAGNPVHTDTKLPWSLEFPMSAAAGIGSIAAQGDSETIGCRISVDGVVKDEKTVTHEVSSFVSCLLKAA
jgi:hypothetical protein